MVDWTYLNGELAQWTVRNMWALEGSVPYEHGHWKPPSLDPEYFLWVWRSWQSQPGRLGSKREGVVVFLNFIERIESAFTSFNTEIFVQSFDVNFIYNNCTKCFSGGLVLIIGRYVMYIRIKIIYILFNLLMFSIPTRHLFWDLSGLITHILCVHSSELTVQKFNTKLTNSNIL